MTTPLQVHLRIQEMSKQSSYISTFKMIKELRDDPDTLKNLEALVGMDLLDETYYRLGQVKLTKAGAWEQIVF